VHHVYSFLAGLLIVGSVIAASPQRTATGKHVKIDSVPARPEDVSTLDGIMKAYYETGSGPAGQPRQWARDRTLFSPDVRFVIISVEKGKSKVQQFSHQEFVDMADPIEVKNGFYEHEIHRITYRYGNWARLICTGESRVSPNGAVTGYGLDDVELFWDGARWWIQHATLVEPRPNDPLPKEYMP
jgi:hypothetical protein